jgi:hypothetical protein
MPELKNPHRQALFPQKGESGRLESLETVNLRRNYANVNRCFVP